MSSVREIARQLGEAIPNPVLAVDAENRIVFCSANALEELGYEYKQLVGSPVEQVIEGFPAPAKWAGAGTSTKEVHTAVRNDGSRFPARISVGAVELDGRELAIVLVSDLSTERATEDALRRTRDQLLEAERLARIGSWEWDLAEDRITWSDQLYRVYGMEPGEFEPTFDDYLSRLHPDDVEPSKQRYARILEDKQPFSSEQRCFKPDGTTFLMQSRGHVVTDDAGNAIRLVGVCEDITAEREAERAQAQLASIVASSDDAIVARSLDGEITSWSPGASGLYGYDASEALGNSITMLLPPEALSEDRQRVEQLERGQIVEPYESRRRRKDGSLIDVSVRMSPVRDADGALIAISMIARDITERKRTEAQLKKLADYDPMTGLLNRRRFEEELDDRVAHARRYGTGGAVLMLDLDNFKYVNDALGHGAGDELLRSVARLLKRRLRETDLLARLGGDEFAALLPEANEADAMRVAHALLEALREHILPISDRPIAVTASIGIACFSEQSETGEQMLAEADRAMYAAKDSGRDRAAAASAAAAGVRGEVSRLDWEHRIREALEQGLFSLYCQPIMDLRSGELSQYELLLRMGNGGGEVIPPGAFLGVAERLGLVHAIDRWVVSEAIGLLSAHPELHLGVNLSALSIDDQHLLRLIRQGVARHDVEPGHLVFEITETAAIGNTDVARRFAEALHELGCAFALDDFGAGFGSFYYLKHLPAQYLKIDGDFVSSPRSRTDELVIESIVRIAQGLGKKTIAEYVEDEATLDALREVGVDYAQGFHIGRPLPVTEVFESATV